MTEYLTLNRINPDIPPHTERLVLTADAEVFEHYQRNVELHRGMGALAIRQLQAANQDHKSRNPDEILSNIGQVSEPYRMKHEGIRYSVGPGIYPSNQFRSSRELHEIARGISGESVLDYGCSHGFVGLATQDSEDITFVDINPVAEGYLRESIDLNDYSDNSEVIIGSMPNLGNRTYDTIFFNPPFHLEDTQTGIGSSLKDDSSVRIIENFWNYAQNYMHDNSTIYCAFSNKDPEALALLERSIDGSGLQRQLIVHKYADTNSDVRIYQVTNKKSE